MTHPINYQTTHLLNETLNQFILSFPQPCTFTHPITQAYVLVNQPFSEKLCVPIEKIVGHRLEAIILCKEWKLGHALNSKTVCEIGRLNQHVCQYKTAISSERNLFSTPKDILLVENYTQSPIFDELDQIIGILGYSQDITAQCDLFNLLCLYRRHYPLQKATHNFLRYLKIEHYFTYPPTYREVMSLLAMFLDNSHKHVAKLLEIKAKTAETHIYQLKNKLNGVSLSDVLKTMRSHNRNMFLHTGFIK